jgi:hypothetical protein
LASFLRLWREQENANIRKNRKDRVSMHAEFLYSNAMPDPYSLSNTLRAVGEFLDRKPDVKLLFASNHGRDIVIL